MHEDHDHGSGRPGKEPLSQLKNLGPVSQRWLNAIGIRNKEQLEYVGVTRAYQLIKSQFPEASVNLLWALEGALTGVSWSTLSPERKVELLAEVRTLE